jgi:nitroreductase
VSPVRTIQPPTSATPGPDHPPRAGAVDLRVHAEEIVWAATRAPSYRDSQPWSFRVLAHQVEVYADFSRSCPVADPLDRQLFLDLGAAVFGVRLAVARLGLRPIVGISRDPGHPDLVAVVVSAGPARWQAEDHELYAELSRRRIVPTSLLAGPVSVDVEVRLTDRIRHEGASARWLNRAADRALLTDLARRTAAELHTEPVPVIGGPAAEIPPVSLVICTPADHRAQWLRAGQALHHALLCASTAGYAASFRNELLEVPLLRERLRSTLGLPGHPQVLLGLGRRLGAPPPPSARRPLADVLRP